MNELDFSFEESPWETYIEGFSAGESVSAARLLTLLEGEEEEAVEDAFAALEARDLGLDLTDLPKTGANGQAALRLRQEYQLAKKGLDPRELEENDPLRLYLEEVSQTPAFGDEALLARQAAQGDETAMERLTNLGLQRVISLAASLAGRGVLLLDLIQEGSLGLWQAICSYRTGDYAAHRDKHIRYCQAKAVTLQARQCGIGQKMRTAMEDYREVDERLLSELGRNPTLEEMAEALHMMPEEAEAVKKMLDDARLLAAAKKQPDLEEEKEAEEQAVEDTAQFQMRQRILDLLSGVSEADAKLLSLRFGLEGAAPMSPGEAGKRLGLTPDEVVAREAAALSKLRSGN